MKGPRPLYKRRPHNKEKEQETRVSSLYKTVVRQDKTIPRLGEIEKHPKQKRGTTATKLWESRTSEYKGWDLYVPLRQYHTYNGYASCLMIQHEFRVIIWEDLSSSNILQDISIHILKTRGSRGNSSIKSLSTWEGRAKVLTTRWKLELI